MFRSLHVVVWGLAGGLTVAVVVVGAVQGDELSGGCVAGGVSAPHLATYQLTPHLVLQGAGAAVLFAGAGAFFRRRRRYAHLADSARTRLKRIVLFSAAYLLAASLKTACQIYELVRRTAWYKACDPNLLDHAANSTLQGPGPGSCGPDYRLFLLKYAAYLCVPIIIAAYLRSALSFSGILKRLVPIAKGYSISNINSNNGSY